MIKLIRKIVSYFSLYYYRLFLKQTKFYIGTHSIILAKFRVKGKKNFIEFGNGCTIRKTRIQINGNNNRISFADNVKVYEKLKILIESNDCIIHIGNNTTVGSAKIQLGEKNTKVLIGDNCMLSREIIINTSDFHSIIDINLNIRINPAKNVIIGNQVWIGNGAYVNKGATINDNSIVAARSVVPGKVYEKNSLIGGVPAKLIKAGIAWDRKIL